MSKQRRARTCIVSRQTRDRRLGWLRLGPFRFACALGRSGPVARKREGDGGSPIGVYGLETVFYRADRVARPRTRLPVKQLKPDDGWCDAVGDPNYNRRVQLPYPASHECLSRTDPLYDIVVVLSHNRRPRIQGGGSAIFMHLARPDWAPTAGCVALTLADLRKLLSLNPKSIRIAAG